jgi:branched-chain amino acid transport system permease protein
MRRPGGGVGRVLARPRVSGAVGIAVLVLVAAAPLLGNEVTVYKAGLVLIFLVGALGQQVLVSWAGQLSLAHAEMIGFPAFVVLGVSSVDHVSPQYLLPLGVAVGAALGGAIALPTLRAHGVQVAIITLAAGIAIDSYLFNQTWLVGPSGGRQAPLPTLGPVTFTDSRSLYPLLVLLVAVCAVVTWGLMHSTWARAWYGIRSDPSATAAMGMSVVAWRILAYVIAGAYAGLAGSLTVVWVQRLTPQTFPTTLSFTYLLVAVVAGSGFLGGIAVAVAVLEGGTVFSSGAGTIAAYAGPVALILTITRYQAGLNGAGRRVMDAFRSRVARPGTSPAPPVVPPAPTATTARAMS